jgi:protoporphyrinogen oxidase
VNYKGNLIDIGGHRFFSKSKKIIDWWLKFLPLDPNSQPSGIEITYRNQITTLNSSVEITNNAEPKMMVCPRKSRIFYENHFFDYPLSLNLKTIRNLGFGKTCKIGASYFKARLFPELPETTLAQFFKNRFGKELYITFFKDYTEKVWGIPCDAIPASWGRQRVKDLNIAKAIREAISSVFSRNKSIAQEGKSVSLIEQFLYPQKGPGQMWETVSKKITELGGTIHLSATAESVIASGQNKIESVIYRDSAGALHELKGDYFFSTIPVKELIANLQGVDIDKKISQLANGLQYRDFIIVDLLVRKETSKNNLSSLRDNWIYLQDKNIKAGRAQIFNNWSPMMVSDANTISIGVEYFCNETDEFWKLPDHEIVQQAIKEMGDIGLIDPADVADSTIVKERKAYPSYTGTYNEFQSLQDFLNGFDNLFPIGRNGMHRYNNSDHSMMTAMIAVENIIAGRKDKTNVWQVNLDEDYHEEL